MPYKVPNLMPKLPSWQVKMPTIESLYPLPDPAKSARRLQGSFGQLGKAYGNFSKDYSQGGKQ